MKATGLFFLLWLGAQCASAVTIVECVDSRGERSFQAACPPGTTQVDQRQIRTGEDTAPAANAEAPVITATLYVVPNCDPCEDVRDFLQSRNVSVTVKDASTEQAVQEELKKVNGTLKVPVTVIGGKVLAGYSRSGLLEALEAEGYVASN